MLTNHRDININIADDIIINGEKHTQLHYEQLIELFHDIKPVPQTALL